MDSSVAWLIGLVIVLSVLVLIIVIVSCWYLRNKNRRSHSRRYTRDEEQPLFVRLAEPRLERAQQQERSALLTCHFYIRTMGDWAFHSQLSQLGSDPEKTWFLVTPIGRTGATSSTKLPSHILTIHPRSDRLNHLMDEESTATFIRTLNNLFGRLHHPYVEPILKLDILYAQKIVITVKKFQPPGSLKDLLHGVTPTANFHVG